MSEPNDSNGVVEINVKTNSTSRLAGNADGSSPAIQSTDSLEQMELVPSERRNSHTASHSMALDCAPPSYCLADPLCARLRDLCDHDFRAESWYLGSLFLIMAFVVGFACIILSSIGIEHLLAILIVIGRIPLVVPLSLICLTTIPLCGIVNKMQQSGPFQRKSPFVLKLAIDSGRGYRISRAIFFGIAPIIGGICSVSFVYSFNGTYASAGSWCLVCMIIFFYASGSCLWSIYSELFSRPGYSRQCDYQAAGST